MARLAGLPKSVTARAEKILEKLEAQAAAEHQAAGTAIPASPVEKPEDGLMASLFSSGISEELLALDIMTMTPLEAMNELYRLQNQAKGEAGKA